MRYLWLALAAALLTASTAAAQQPSAQQQPVQQPSSNLDPSKRLDFLLLQWEQSMSKIQSMDARIQREDEDATFRTKTLWVGKAQYLKPNLALLDLRMQQNPARIEKYLCTGAFLYEWKPDQKQIVYHEMPAPKPGQVADDNVLAFILGMKAAEAKRRYGLKLAGEDKNYIYIEALPRTPTDQQEFSRAQLALNQGSYLPRMLRFTRSNGNVTTWDIPNIEANAPVNRTLFVKPDVPSGWKLMRDPGQVPRPGEAPARVMRGSNP